jgi:hypothetical protein
MTVAAGALPALSTTARPADKGTERRLVSALVELSGGALRRSDARAVISERLGLGDTPDEIEAYLRSTFRADPTGVTAVRNVARERGRS